MFGPPLPILWKGPLARIRAVTRAIHIRVRVFLTTLEWPIAKVRVHQYLDMRSKSGSVLSHYEGRIGEADHSLEDAPTYVVYASALLATLLFHQMQSSSTRQEVFSSTILP